jgi:hypothetical protein
MTMSLTPPPSGRLANVTIWSGSMNSLGPAIFVPGVGNAAVPAANVVMYVPFVTNSPLTVTRLWWWVSAAAGNIDLGIFDDAGLKLVSTGTTLVAGSSVIQSVDVTDTVIPKGSYYFGLVASTVTTLTISRFDPAAGIAQGLGCLEQTLGGLPLPSNATFAKYTRAYVPTCGLVAYRSI